jgi:hypothetical protein
MRRRRHLEDCEEDPLTGFANLFDLGIVFALGFMVSLITYLGLPELLGNEDMVLVKNPGAEDMEMIIKTGEQLERLQPTGSSLAGEGGEKLGTAYRLPSGKVVYVPAVSSDENND